MSARVVILRPQPGAEATVEAACALGLDALCYPLFSVEPMDWTPPDPAGFDALMLTSANTIRHAGRGWLAMRRCRYLWWARRPPPSRGEKD